MFINYLFLVALSISSIYIFPSGLPQPADFLFIAFILLTFVSVLFSSQLGRNRKIKLSRVIFPPYLWLFILLVFIVCALWSLSEQTSSFFKFFLFYFYNALLISAVCVRLNTNDNFKRVVLTSLYIALIVSGFGVLYAMMSSGGRITGFFNNPNQLAFYSLLAWSCALILTECRIQLNPLYWLAFIFSALGVFSAASLGAMAGFIVLLVPMVLKNISKHQIVKSLASVGIIALFVSITMTDQIITIYQGLETRLVRAESKIEDLSSERNYDRLLAFPEYLILGAGEGEFQRFYPHDKHEIHSTAGTLLFSYGILGTTLFFLMWISVLRIAPPTVWLVASAPAIYSLTHMGLRTSMFWILLALIWSYYKHLSRRCPG